MHLLSFNNYDSVSSNGCGAITQMCISNCMTFISNHRCTAKNNILHGQFQFTSGLINSQSQFSSKRSIAEEDRAVTCFTLRTNSISLANQLQLLFMFRRGSSENKLSPHPFSAKAPSPTQRVKKNLCCFNNKKPIAIVLTSYSETAY